MRARRILLRLLVAAIVCTAGIAIVVLLTGLFRSQWRILATTSAISVAALLAVPAGALLDRGRAVLLGRAGAVLTSLAFALTLGLIWRDGWSAGYGKAWGVVGTLALAVAQAAAVESRRRDTDSSAIERLTYGSMVTATILAAMSVAAILTSIDDSSYYRWLGAIAILDVLFVVLAAVLRRGRGGIAQTHRFRLNGQLVEEPARDFGGAVAAAIRRAERAGVEVKRIERA